MQICGQAGLILYAVGTMFYLASPFDVIPEAVFGLFGLTDDTLVIIYFFIAVG